MTIWTTYLAKLKNDPKMPERIGSCFVYIITTRAEKANRCVAPDWSFLNEYKKDTNCCYACQNEAWAKYEKAYLEKIQNSKEAKEWIQKRSNEALIGNILLVCYEKDPTHCHRRLLAEEIARLKNWEVNNKHAEYRGDWND